MKLLNAFLRYDKLVFLTAVGLFLVCIYYAIVREMHFLYLIPVALIFTLVAVENFRLIWYGALLMMPVSVNLDSLIQSSSVQFPTDLLAVALMGIVIFKMVSAKDTYYRFYRHPISWAVFFYMLWQIFALIGAEDLMVSGKYVFNAYWVVFAFYLLSTIVFTESKTIIYFFWLIGIGFVFAMLIIMAKYVLSGRNPFTLRFNPMPVFRDHTLFGAFTTFFVPIFLLFSFWGKFSKTFRTASFIILCFFIAGLFFSYSRGAWASTAAGLVFMGIFVLRRYIIKLAIPITILIIGGGTFVYTSYMQSIQRNESVSREGFAEHIKSMTNFTTDDSNVERINRWSSAWDMWKDRPLLGFGPGSYAFEYGNYQKAVYRTKISTNHGTNGTAHNEFMLALSETGLPGAILTFFLFTVPIFMGLRGYIRSNEWNIRLIYLGVTFGLISYLMHAFVNNFLDQDKVGVAFFGMLAILTALDLKDYREAKVDG